LSLNTLGKSVVHDFGLEKNEWLSKLFDIRDMWIPAYFRDLFLREVLRKTSRFKVKIASLAISQILI